MRFRPIVRVAVLCSLAISFFVLASVSTANAQQECNNVAGAPAPTTGSIVPATDVLQTNRLFRDGRAGTCSFLRPATTSAGSYASDSYTFTNTSGGPICVYVDLDATGCGVATNQLSISAYATSYDPANILTNIVGDPGLSTGGAFATSMNFSVPTGGTYIIVVHDVNAGTSCPSYTFRQTWANGCRQPGFDAANDGSADLAVFLPTAGPSFSLTQPIGGPQVSTFLGTNGDVPVPGDYTGDETSDVAMYRPGAQSVWYTTTNAATNYGAKFWGTTGDVPVQGDYDRDGITDLAVFRPSDNNWYIIRSSTSSFIQINLGAAGDKPVPADYDGDGKTDPAVYRPSSGLWGFLSSAGAYGTITNAIHGVATDIPVPADYDGDGKADIAVYRPSEGNWYILRTSLTATGIGSNLTVRFGAANDIPQPADYDGDKKADQAVFRPSDNTWWINRSTAGLYANQLGGTNAVPFTAPNKIP